MTRETPADGQWPTTGVGRHLREHTLRHWQARCLTCAARFPLPGIRYKAVGRPVKILRCPDCARWRCCQVEPKDPAPGA